MPRIACLHTAPSNAPLFDAAAAPLGLVLTHVVRADLLAAVEARGELTAEIAAGLTAALAELAATADAVILTCSSLGEAVDPEGPVIRADAALAAAALRDPGRVAVLYTAPTSRGPTERVFRAAAKVGQGVPEVRCVEGAWAAFRAGDEGRHIALIRQAMGEAVAAGADRIALAQCSMAPAGVAGAQGVPVLTVPDAALAAAMAARGRV